MARAKDFERAAVELNCEILGCDKKTLAKHGGGQLITISEPGNTVLVEVPGYGAIYGADLEEAVGKMRERIRKGRQTLEAAAAQDKKRAGKS